MRVYTESFIMKVLVDPTGAQDAPGHDLRRLQADQDRPYQRCPENALGAIVGVLVGVVAW